MVFEENRQEFFLRVRLAPNSSCCQAGGVFTNARGEEFLKISVVSVPEKGKANEELLKFLAKSFKIAKSAIEIVAGETDRCKKLRITGSTEGIKAKISRWLEEGK